MSDPVTAHPQTAAPISDPNAGPQGPLVQKTQALRPPGPPGQQRWSTAGLEGLLSGYFVQLEHKIEDNRKKSREDLIEFWTLKGLVLTGTLGAGVLEAYGKGSWVPALGLLASAGVVIDALRPKGALFRLHRLAENDLTLLLEQVRSEWEIAKLKANPALMGNDLRNTTVSILEKIAVKTGLLGHMTASVESVLDEPKASPAPVSNQAA